MNPTYMWCRTKPRACRSTGWVWHLPVKSYFSKVVCSLHYNLTPCVLGVDLKPCAICCLAWIQLLWNTSCSQSALSAGTYEAWLLLAAMTETFPCHFPASCAQCMADTSCVKAFTIVLMLCFTFHQHTALLSDTGSYENKVCSCSDYVIVL